MSNQITLAEIVMNSVAPRREEKEKCEADRKFCLRRMSAANIERSKMLEKVTLGSMVADVNL